MFCLYEGPWSLVTHIQINTPVILELIRIRTREGNKPTTLRSLEHLLYQLCSSIQLFFCGNCSRNDTLTRCHFTCSLKKRTCFKQTTHSPSLRKASSSNPHPLFSNGMQNNIMLVRPCWSSFCKKHNCILLGFSHPNKKIQRSLKQQQKWKKDKIKF